LSLALGTTSLKGWPRVWLVLINKPIDVGEIQLKPRKVLKHKTRSDLSIGTVPDNLEYCNHNNYVQPGRPRCSYFEKTISGIQTAITGNHKLVVKPPPLVDKLLYSVHCVQSMYMRAKRARPKQFALPVQAITRS